MPKNDQEEAFEKLLSADLARTLDFVKFAEAKNAALLAFASAWIVASINLLTGSNKLPSGYSTAFTAALPFFGLAGLICIISFLPRMLNSFYKPADGSKHLLFFGDVATLDIGAFKDRITERYMPKDGCSATAGYLEDLTVQIAVNSRIAKRKFALFNFAALCVLAAISILMLTAILHLPDVLRILPGSRAGGIT